MTIVIGDVVIVTIIIVIVVAVAVAIRGGAHLGKIHSKTGRDMQRPHCLRGGLPRVNCGRGRIVRSIAGVVTS